MVLNGRDKDKELKNWLTDMAVDHEKVFTFKIFLAILIIVKICLFLSLYLLVGTGNLRAKKIFLPLNTYTVHRQ